MLERGEPMSDERRHIPRNRAERCDDCCDGGFMCSPCPGRDPGKLLAEVDRLAAELERLRTAAHSIVEQTVYRWVREVPDCNHMGVVNAATAELAAALASGEPDTEAAP